MTLITGGLGGLGMLAAYEISAAGAGFIVTTSRSGRIAGNQPDLILPMNQMQQNTIHYNVRCDTSDGSAVSDLMHWIQRPGPDHLEEMELFDYVLHDLELHPEKVDEAGLEKLEQTRDHICQTIELFKEEMEAKEKPGPDAYQFLRQMLVKEEKIGRFINVVRNQLGKPSMPATIVPDIPMPDGYGETGYAAPAPTKLGTYLAGMPKPT